MEQQRGLCSFRAASCGAALSTGQPTIRLSISSTTGSPVELTVPRGETVEGLRTRISQKLRLQTDRIALLYKDRQLTAGNLLDLGVADGSKLTLVPVVEAGLICSTARAERSIMDILESLTEVQISDFLSGRSPLTINLGIGAHVMYVQLQLSAQSVAELQQHHDTRAGGSSTPTEAPTAVRMSPPASASAQPPADTTGSTTSAASQTAPAADPSDSTPFIRFSAPRPRTSCSPSAPTSHRGSSPRLPCPPHYAHTASRAPSSPSLPPHTKRLLQAPTLVCSPAPTCSSPGPRSPAPASTFREADFHTSSTAELSEQPGAVIESLVSHSPGVFSGTFSGTLAPCSQSGVSHPRSGVAVILQILNDLLRAAQHHQGAPQVPPGVHSPAAKQSTEKDKALVTPRPEHLREAPAAEECPPLHSCTQENRALHCKLQRLQFLMHQRRLRRRTRRSSHPSPTFHPYHRRHQRP